MTDPLVLVHARVLLTSSPGGACGYIDCDVRDSGRILDEAREILDFARPVALIMFGTMGNVVNDEAAAIIRRLVGALAPGSFLALNDGTGQLDRKAARRRSGSQSSRARPRMWPARQARSRASSTAWSLSNRVSCPPLCGGRRPPSSALRMRWMRPAGWRGNPEPRIRQETGPGPRRRGNDNVRAPDGKRSGPPDDKKAAQQRHLRRTPTTAGAGGPVIPPVALSCPAGYLAGTCEVPRRYLGRFFRW